MNERGRIIIQPDTEVEVPTTSKFREISVLSQWEEDLPFDGPPYSGSSFFQEKDYATMGQKTAQGNFKFIL